MKPDAKYFAFDIDSRMIKAVNNFFNYMGYQQTASCKDVLVSIPEVQTDVVFFFKSLPCIEQQEKGGGFRLLKDLNASHIIISFPAKSLGGREKGMKEHYDKLMKQLVENVDVKFNITNYPSEIFYILNMQQ